jgi:glycosyltransferase involved in cell wall biosynthesis
VFSLSLLSLPLPLLLPHIPNLLFVGVGGVRKHYMEDVLEPLMAAHHLAPYVHLTGFCDELRFVPHIQHAHVCLCPHLKTALTDTTFPNKVFLYQLFGKTVVAADCVPIARYLNETNSGLVYPSDDHDALAQAILTLYHNPDMSQQLGAQGQHAVLSRYNWAMEKTHLLRAYQQLLPLSVQSTKDDGTSASPIGLSSY